MLAPPMNDTIKLMVTQYDEAGNVIKDRYGVTKRVESQSIARVQLSSAVIYNSNGEQVNATLEVDFPPETEVRSGDIVEWVDQFGAVVKGPIEKLSEAKSANGKKVWFRTGFTV